MKQPMGIVLSASVPVAPWCAYEETGQKTRDHHRSPAAAAGSLPAEPQALAGKDETRSCPYSRPFGGPILLVPVKLLSFCCCDMPSFTAPVVVGIISSRGQRAGGCALCRRVESQECASACLAIRREPRPIHQSGRTIRKSPSSGGLATQLQLHACSPALWKPSGMRTQVSRNHVCLA